MAILLSLLAPLLVHAADTSGCSPMRTNVLQATTPANATVQVTYSHPNAPNCWNASDSNFSVEYVFVQPAGSADPQVSFWLKAADSATTVVADVECKPVINSTGASKESICTATASIAAPAQGPVTLEIAPVRDGVWDTGGLNHNMVFTFGATAASYTRRAAELASCELRLDHLAN